MNKVFLIFIIGLLISCNSNPENSPENTNDSIAVDNHPASELLLGSGGCFLMIQQKDTATLNIKVVDHDVVSGVLQYKRFEKDQNNGSINGLIRENLIIANYTFQSEGMSSVREIVFKIKGDSLFEGYGEIVVKNDTAKFADKSNLKFMETPFVKVNCKEN